MTTSLPSRQREANTDPTRSSGGTDQLRYYSQTVRNSNENGESTAQGTVVDMDMDYSPDFGLGERNPPSDHPTPSTLNSSSNTSYTMSGVDNPSPPKKQQKQGGVYSNLHGNSSFEKIQPTHNPTTTEPPHIPDMTSIPGKAYSTNLNGSSGTTGSGAFSVPAVWDMPTPNPDMSNVDLNVNMDSLNDAQWAQLLNNHADGSNGWDNWRPS